MKNINNQDHMLIKVDKKLCLSMLNNQEVLYSNNIDSYHQLNSDDSPHKKS